ncbi:hypothetical protein TWF730_002728 [Orbilia blumenaviensis]|uniref:Uncharacterized protein n=1 Tax=Orbilia blumenaviensis TaxID=1796055 RepID=A0AAV9UBC0_9PEZI
MRYLPFLAVFGAASCVNAQMTRCVADNCLRAIRASAFPNRPGTADCRVFFGNYVTKTATDTTTSILADLTVTVTSTTVFVPLTSSPAATSVTIPAYASPCSGLARYSSACACVGITETADPTTTTLTITSSTTQIEVVSTIRVPEFILQLQDGVPGGYIAKSLSNGEAEDDYVQVTGNIANAAIFHLLPDGRLESGGAIMKAGSWNVLRDWVWNGELELICGLDANHMLSCASDDWNIIGTYLEGFSRYIAVGKAAADFTLESVRTDGVVVRVKALPPPI